SGRPASASRPVRRRPAGDRRVGGRPAADRSAAPRRADRGDPPPPGGSRSPSLTPAWRRCRGSLLGGASAAGQDAGMPSAIDIHAHFYPQAWLDLVAQEGKASGAEVTITDSPRGRGPALKVGDVTTPPLI